MGSSFHSLHCHIVFSTKERRALIASAWRAQLHEYLGGTLRGLGTVAHAIGGIADHVHILVGLKTTDTPAAVVRELKKASSVWAAAQHEPLFAWQEGYAIFSVSSTHLPVVQRYVMNQEHHHRTITFLDELQRLLDKNGVNYDPQYLP